MMAFHDFLVHLAMWLLFSESPEISQISQDLLRTLSGKNEFIASRPEIAQQNPKSNRELRQGVGFEILHIGSVKPYLREAAP
jgi:hypothetical protein